MVRIGIFGGTFNPIHLGHLLFAETARESLALDRIVFIPARQPPHKAPKHLLPGAVRFELVQLAVRDHPAFVASDIELQRPGKSYSIDTAKALRQQLPKAALFLLIGQDMLSVPWLAWKELQRLCTVVVARRPGSRKASGARQARVKWLDMPQIDISSSDIRRRVAAGGSIRYLVPAAVAREIQQRGLYRKGGSSS